MLTSGSISKAGCIKQSVTIPFSTAEQAKYYVHTAVLPLVQFQRAFRQTETLQELEAAHDVAIRTQMKGRSSLPWYVQSGPSRNPASNPYEYRLSRRVLWLPRTALLLAS